MPIIQQRTEALAISEAQRTITQQFEERNIQAIIERAAETRLSSQAGQMMDNRISAATAAFEQQSREFARLNLLNSLMTSNSRPAYDEADSIKRNNRLLDVRNYAEKILEMQAENYHQKTVENYEHITQRVVEPSTIENINAIKTLDDLIQESIKAIKTSYSLTDVANAFAIIICRS